MKHNETFFSSLVLAAAVLWGTTGTVQSFAPPGASPLSIGSVRLAVGGSQNILSKSSYFIPCRTSYCSGIGIVSAERKITASFSSRDDTGFCRIGYPVLRRIT